MHLIKTSSRVLLNSFMTLAFLFSVSQAQANTVSLNGAKDIESDIEAIIQQLDDGTAASGMKLMQDGELKVVPRADSYYAVTFPHLSIVMPSEEKLDIGVISMNVMPTESDKMWKITMAMPTPMAVYDDDEALAFTIDIGEQKFAGVWHTEAQYFIQEQTEYKNIVAKDAQDNFVFTIPVLTSQTDLDETSPGLLSGGTYMNMKNINLDVGAKSMLSIDGIVLEADISDYDYKKMHQYREDVSGMMKDLQTAQDGEMDDDIGSKQVNQLMTSIMDNLMSAWKGFDARATITGIRGSDPTGMMPVSLDGLTFSYGSTDFNTDDASIYYGFSHSGLNVQVPDPTTQAMIPTTSNFKLRFDSVPLQKLMQEAKTVTEKAAAQPNAAQMHTNEIKNKIPQMLADAGTQLEISNSFVEGKDYAVHYSGNVRADASAAKKAVGDALITFHGMDKIIQQIQASQAEGGSMMPPMLQQGLAMLGFVQMVGQQGNDENGRPARVYEFELKPDGTVMLNGTDLQTMMSGAMGGQPGAAAPAAN